MARPNIHDWTKIEEQMKREGKTFYKIAKELGIPIRSAYARKNAVRNKLLPPIKVYQLEGQEIYMMGRYVGVVWDTSLETGKRTDDEPYLIFCTIVNDPDDKEKFYQSDESPVDGGFSPEVANQIIEELKRAVRYMEKAK